MGFKVRPDCGVVEVAAVPGIDLITDQNDFLVCKLTQLIVRDVLRIAGVEIVAGYGAITAGGIAEARHLFYLRNAGIPHGIRVILQNL